MLLIRPPRTTALRAAKPTGSELIGRAGHLKAQLTRGTPCLAYE